MASLPEDLLIEILVRSPVKSLLRLRCVCKSWCDLIRSSDFIKRHLNYHKNNNNVLVSGSLEDQKQQFVSLYTYDSLSIISPGFQIPIDSVSSEPCNGLLCLSLEKTIAFCNPAMRELKVLSPPPFPYPDGWICYAVGIGFGFDSNTNEYKVIRIVELNQDGGNNFIYKYEIFNSGTNSWRQVELDHDFPYAVEHPCDFGTLFNGAIRWLAFGDSGFCILSFNMSTEEFQEMKLPDIDLKEEKRKFLAVLNGSLALVAFTESSETNPRTPQFIEIWVMCHYGVAESWTKQFTIGPVFGICFPYILWKNKAIILVSHEGQLVSCALDTLQTNYLDIHGHCAMLYQESLVSIN